MGYLHIENLYQNKTILMFKECYALEKIHGTSAHISWNAERKDLKFFAGGVKHESFVAIFDSALLMTVFSELFPLSDVVIHGEAYGGKCQGMSKTYGDALRFVGFDVKVGGFWLEVPNAAEVCNSLGLEFCDYVRIPTDISLIDEQRDRESIQAIRVGMGNCKQREGVVLRPILELNTKTGGRVIAKHKQADFRETKTVRELTDEEQKKLTDAVAIADEFVTEMRLVHVLDKLVSPSIKDMQIVISAMVQDIEREAATEIVSSPQVRRSIGSKTAKMFTQYLKKDLLNQQ
jgi:hypothetical protein